MDYLVEGKRYILSYSDLKTDYLDYVSMPDDQFFNDIPKVLHFVCVVSYLKEIPSNILVSDEGIIHQLVHLLDGTSNDTNFNVERVKRRIRRDFKVLFKLA